MAIANPFKAGGLTDLSEQINIVPNTWGVLNQLGVFRHEHGTQRTVLIPRDQDEVSVLEDRNWNERNQTVGHKKKDMIALQVPHYPADDAIYPADINGVLDWDDPEGGAALSLDKVRAWKMERLRNAHALTLEKARFQLMKDGTVYAPNGTVVVDYYNEFDAGSRHTEGIDLSDENNNPKSAIEDEVYGRIQDNIQDGTVVSDIVAVCSPSFFNALTSNPFVFESYQYFQQPQGAGVLNQRMGTGRGLDARHRVFTYAGVTFIEVRGGAGGVPFVEDKKAYAFPMGTDIFRTKFAPAERFGSVNQEAMESYYFEFASDKNDKIEIETETNFLNIVTRPECIVTLNNTAS